MHYSAGVDATAQAYPAPLFVMECPRRPWQLIPEMNHHRNALRAQPADAVRAVPFPVAHGYTQTLLCCGNAWPLMTG